MILSKDCDESKCVSKGRSDLFDGSFTCYGDVDGAFYPMMCSDGFLPTPVIDDKFFMLRLILMRTGIFPYSISRAAHRINIAIILLLLFDFAPIPSVQQGITNKAIIRLVISIIFVMATMAMVVGNIPVE